VSKKFGTTRNPLSGRSSKHSASDSLHEHLFLEMKRCKRFPLIDAWDRLVGSRSRAARNYRPPFLEIESDQGQWLMCHISDLLNLNRQLSMPEPRVLSCKVRRKRYRFESWWETAVKLAETEQKIPVLCVTAHRRKGFWTIFLRSDLEAIAHYLDLAERGNV